MRTINLSISVLLILFLSLNVFSENIGNTTIYGSTSYSTNRRAMPFTMTEDGRITSISMYHEGGNGEMILAVYENGTNGLPGNRLASTTSSAVNSSSGWQTIDLQSSVFVSAGSTIWLAWVYENIPGIAYEVGSPGRANSSNEWTGGMPSPFGSSTQANYIYSIYATYYNNNNPEITQHPQSQTVSEGSNVTFQCNATGSPNPTYQWYENSSPMSGQTSSTLSLSSVACSENGNSYYAIASNGVSPDAQSTTATLTVSDCDPTNGWASDFPGITYTDDRIGIGTSSPDYPLHVIGRCHINGSSMGGGGFWLTEDANDPGSNEYNGYIGLGTKNEDHIGFYYNSSWNLVLKPDGNVGIGTTNPGDYKLAVEGIIGARELVITNQPWADYVLSKDYKLKSLKEVENFINKNGHLPGIPTEEEVEKNGINIGDMQAKFLEKIEEMTLHMIKMQKRIDELEEAVRK